MIWSFFYLWKLKKIKEEDAYTSYKEHRTLFLLENINFQGSTLFVGK